MEELRTEAGGRVFARGGTDGANVVLFWPEVLPGDADVRVRSDPIGLVEESQREGRLLWFRSEGDGRYGIAVFLGDEVPGELLEHCVEVDVRPGLTVRGVGYFGGIEYLFKRDSSLAARHPGSLGEVRVPAGTYEATVWRTRLPEGFEGEWICKRVGPRARMMGRLYGALLGWCVAAAFGMAVMLCTTPWRVSRWGVFACLGVGLVTLGVRLTGACRRAEAAREEFAHEFPAYVVRLRGGI